MENQQRQSDEQAIRNYQVTLLELLDRLIDKGVVVKGEILLSVAEVDLVYLNLALLLSAVKTVEIAANGKDRGVREIPNPKKPSPQAPLEKPQAAAQNEVAPKPKSIPAPEPRKESERSSHRKTQADNDTRIKEFFPPLERKPQRRDEAGINIDPENVEKGLVALVLTLVDLIRQLMEKQAIRRVEEGQLTEAEIERVGNAFFLLAEKIEELKKTFDLADEDLNLHLGPLGDLL